MDDISQQLNKILSDPQSMAQIQGIMSGLGLGGQNSAPPTPSPQTTATDSLPTQNNMPSQNEIQSLLQNFIGGSSAAPQNNSTPVQNSTSSPASSFIPDANMIAKLAPLLSQMGKDDKTTNLLNALRPMLSTERGAKIDQAIRILQLMRLFPVIKESGMLQSVLGGLF